MTWSRVNWSLLFDIRSYTDPDILWGRLSDWVDQSDLNQFELVTFGKYLIKCLTSNIWYLVKIIAKNLDSGRLFLRGQVTKIIMVNDNLSTNRWQFIRISTNWILFGGSFKFDLLRPIINRKLEYFHYQVFAQLLGIRQHIKYNSSVYYYYL